MNRYNMSYDDVLNSPYQRLLFLAKSIPKFESEKDKKTQKEKKSSGDLKSFLTQNNLL